MTHCIDPVVQQVQAPELKPVVYRSLAKPEPQQLMAPNHPVLAPSQLRDHGIRRALSLASLSLTPYIGVKDRLGGGVGWHGGG